MNTRKTTLYRDKQNAKLMGVCAGIADYTGINTFWIRLAMFLSIFSPFNWITLPMYFLAGLMLNKKPPHLYRDVQEEKYWQRVRQSPQRTAREVRSSFRDIDRRLADVEHFYVSSNQGLSAEIERLR